MKQKGRADSASYHFSSYIVDQHDNTIKKKKYRTMKIVGESATVRGLIKVDNLDVGFYKLKIKVIDDYTTKTSEKIKNFYIKK